MTTEAIQTFDRDQAVIPTDVSAAALELAVGKGDLSRLSSADRLNYIGAICKWVGLNPLTKPIQIINIKGKDTLYADKSCAEQLRGLHKITTRIVERIYENGIYIVRATARKPDGQEDESIGAVACFDKAAPDDRANAMMKAETKAKRRVTLSICGLGFMPDVSELETINGVQAHVDGALKAETASDRASLLNAAVEQPAIEVQEVKESAAASPQATAVPSQTADAAAPDLQNNPPETKSGPFGVGTVRTEVAVPEEPFANPDGTLSDSTCRNLEIIMSEKTPAHQKNFLGWLVSRKQIQPGQGLQHLKHEAANYILKQAAKAHEAVERWASKQNPQPV